MDFKVKYVDAFVQLDWITAMEINNDFFEVYHRNDQSDFKKIAQIKGFGNSTNIQHYQYQDFNYNLGWNYYQLKQVDEDGTHEYFYIQSVFVAPKVKLFPNPSTGIITVSLDDNERFNFFPLKLFSLDGSLVYSQIITKKTTTINLNNLPKACYFLTIDTTVMKVILQ